MAENLRQFLSEIATDPTRLGSFIADPDAAMDEAGLHDEDKKTIKTGNVGLINQRLLSDKVEGQEALQIGAPLIGPPVAAFLPLQRGLQTPPPGTQVLS